jgi:hypothetical protein
VSLRRNARAGSRPITVDGVAYRWSVVRKVTEVHGVGVSPLTFVVQLADGTGAKLVVALPDATPASWVVVPERVPGSVRPRTVAAAVRRAIEQGWQPARPGPQFVLAHPPR